jgi:hypothetical protein
MTERERTAPRTAPAGGGGPEGDGLDARLAQDILDAADRILDSIKPINAQQYLEQNQQRGGE